MKLPLITLALAGALCCTHAIAADAAVTPKAAKPASTEAAAPRQKPAEPVRKEAGKAEAPGKSQQQLEVPVKVVLAAD